MPRTSPAAPGRRRPPDDASCAAFSTILASGSAPRAAARCSGVEPRAHVIQSRLAKVDCAQGDAPSAHSIAAASNAPA